MRILVLSLALFVSLNLTHAKASTGGVPNNDDCLWLLYMTAASIDMARDTADESREIVKDFPNITQEQKEQLKVLDRRKKLEIRHAANLATIWNSVCKGLDEITRDYMNAN